MTLNTNNNDGINEEELDFIFSSLKNDWSNHIGKYLEKKESERYVIWWHFFHAEQEKQLMQTKNAENKALNWTKNTQMATSRIVLALNLYLRVRDEGFDTKCGENIGETLIPRLGEN